MGPPAQDPMSLVKPHQTMICVCQVVDGTQSGSTGQDSEGWSSLGYFLEPGFRPDVQGQVRSTCSRERTRAVGTGCVQVEARHKETLRGSESGELRLPCFGELGPAGMDSWELW